MRWYVDRFRLWLRQGLHTLLLDMLHLALAAPLRTVYVVFHV